MRSGSARRPMSTSAARRCSVRTIDGGVESSTARRNSSWRNASAEPVSTSTAAVTAARAP